MPCCDCERMKIASRRHPTSNWKEVQRVFYKFITWTSTCAVAQTIRTDRYPVVFGCQAHTQTEPGRPPALISTGARAPHRPMLDQGIQLAPVLAARLPPPGKSWGVYPPLTAVTLTIWNDTAPLVTATAVGPGGVWHVQLV